MTTTSATDATLTSAKRVLSRACGAVAVAVADVAAYDAQVSDVQLASAPTVDLATTVDAAGTKTTLPLCPADYSCQKYGSICCIKAKTCTGVCIDCAPPECLGEDPSTGNCGTDLDCGLGFCDHSSCVPSACSCTLSGWTCTDDCRGRCIGKPGTAIKEPVSISAEVR